jgi:hypothetical protein
MTRALCDRYAAPHESRQTATKEKLLCGSAIAAGRATPWHFAQCRKLRQHDDEIVRQKEISA